MPEPLADLHVAIVLPCEATHFRNPLTWQRWREYVADWRRVECARVFLADRKGNASPDPAEVIFDPWLRVGEVFYGSKRFRTSGPDLQSVSHSWLRQAQARGL